MSRLFNIFKMLNKIMLILNLHIIYDIPGIDELSSLPTNWTGLLLCSESLVVNPAYAINEFVNRSKSITTDNNSLIDIGNR